MKPPTIRVKAVPGVLVPVPRLRGDTARYVARNIDFVAIQAGQLAHDVAYPPKPFEEVSSALFDVFSEICRSVRDGDLLPADKMTADYFRLPYDVKPLRAERI